MKRSEELKIRRASDVWDAIVIGAAFAAIVSVLGSAGCAESHAQRKLPRLESATAPKAVKKVRVAKARKQLDQLTETDRKQLNALINSL